MEVGKVISTALITRRSYVGACIHSSRGRRPPSPSLSHSYTVYPHAEGAATAYLSHSSMMAHGATRCHCLAAAAAAVKAPVHHITQLPSIGACPFVSATLSASVWLHGACRFRLPMHDGWPSPRHSLPPTAAPGPALAVASHHAPHGRRACCRRPSRHTMRYTTSRMLDASTPRIAECARGRSASVHTPTRCHIPCTPRITPLRPRPLRRRPRPAPSAAA